MGNVVNMWGTNPALIDEDEFCPECEREVPFHYASCPGYPAPRPLGYSG